MARPKNTVPSEDLRLAVSPAMRTALEKIASTGLFGMNPNDVAVRLIERGLREVVDQVMETKDKLNKI